MDEGNIAAEAGVKAGVNYVEKNNLGTVTANQLIALQDLKPFQATEKSITFTLYFLKLRYFNSIVCGTLDQMIDAGTPPDLVLDALIDCPHIKWMSKQQIE